MREDLIKYKETEAASQSLLSALDVHPRSLVETDGEDEEYFRFGSLVDCLMFTPEDYDELFFQISVPKPGDKMGEWLDAYLNIELEPDYRLQDAEKLILKARESVNYNSRLSDQVALDKFNKVCLPYLNEVAIAGDRTIITSDNFTEAIAMQSKLLDNEFTAPYFSPSSKDIEILFQVPIYFTLEGVEFKSLIDIVVINHKKKVIQLADLKTTSKSLLSFERSFTDYRYYLQASLYQYGAGLFYKGYKMSSTFDFVVANTWEEPMIWCANQMHLSLGIQGGITRYGRKIKGVYQLIEDYKWHTQNQKYEYQANVYANHGKKQIDIL